MAVYVWVARGISPPSEAELSSGGANVGQKPWGKRCGAMLGRC